MSLSQRASPTPRRSPLQLRRSKRRFGWPIGRSAAAGRGRLPGSLRLPAGTGPLLGVSGSPRHPATFALSVGAAVRRS
eukprot:13365402-Alexandrium_andersonii.AAC.1